MSDKSPRPDHSVVGKAGVDTQGTGLGDLLGQAHPTPHYVQQQRAQAQAKSDAEAKAKQQSDLLPGQLAAANQAYGYAWINGQRATIVGFVPAGQPNAGAPIYAYEGGKVTPGAPSAQNNWGKPQLNSTNTAFGALNGLAPNITPNGQFTLSAGPADTFTGQTAAGDPYGDGPVRYGSGDHSASANTVSDARNMMTVGQGVQWFLNLSVQHPDAYKHLVDQLRSAGYLPKGVAAKGYSNDAAVAFATAANDLSQVNTTPGGRETSLDQFLTSKSQDLADQTVNAYQPVDRSYQDPATLAASARSAAQAALGRALTPEEEARFEAAYRGKENAAYDAVDAAKKQQTVDAAQGKSGPTAGYTAPDTAGEADSFVQGDQFAGQRQAYSALEYVKAFQSLIHGSGNL